MAVVPDVSVVEVIGGNEEACGVQVGAVLGTSIEPAVPRRYVAVVGVPQLVSQGGAVLDDAHAAPGGDSARAVVIPPLRPAAVPNELDA